MIVRKVGSTIKIPSMGVVQRISTISGHSVLFTDWTKLSPLHPVVSNGFCLYELLMPRTGEGWNAGRVMDWLALNSAR